MAVLPGSGSGWVSILGMLRLLFHPTGMCKMPGQGVLVGLAKSLEKLSSGFRINRAADDAAGLAISEGLRSQVRGNRQAVRNAQDGISVIQTAEGALNEVHSILQRMRTLAVQGANDTNDTKSRSNIRAELVQLRDELNRIGKVTNFNGTKLLNGDASGAKALKFQVGANGSDFDRIVVDFKDADVTKISDFGGEGYVSNVKSATTAQLAAATADDAKYAMAIGDKVINFNFKKPAGGGPDPKLSEVFEEALKESHIEGYVAGDAKEVLSKDTVSIDNAKSVKDAIFKLKIGEKELKFKVTDTNGGTVDHVAKALQGEIEKEGLTQDYRIELDGGKLKVTALKENSPQVRVKLTVEGGAAGATKVGTAPSTTLLEGKLGEAAGNGIKFTVDDTNRTIKMEMANGKNIDVDMDHCLTKLGNPAGTGDTNITLTPELVSGTKNWVKASINTLKVDNHDEAQKLISVLDEKINSVSKARANIGAIQNRFEHTITNLNVAVENLAASESRIRDTDMAQEMMQFTRNQILSQAGTSMLAQANQVPQGVLSLLR
ncbi:bacterial flagellin domain protein [Mobiluncus mulieris FB024-16]|uniref:flagellin N-terminal helical domain-containing protein n=1 Tax=Mobiluncus mulieris TaxID=2052 RepID=UPI0001E519AC|nr:flagellin [Mobiluncus mulieris]EFN92660.1 bacterial flagellin domain protein [Mobiluncus mulieris FB024-16]